MNTYHCGLGGGYTGERPTLCGLILKDELLQTESWDHPADFAADYYMIYDSGSDLPIRERNDNIDERCPACFSHPDLALYVLADIDRE